MPPSVAPMKNASKNLVRSESESRLGRRCLQRMRANATSTVSLVDCLTSDFAGCAPAGAPHMDLTKTLVTPAPSHAATSGSAAQEEECFRLLSLHSGQS